MIFKQGVLKYVKIKEFITFIATHILLIGLTILIIFNDDDFIFYLKIIFIFYIPLILFLFFGGFASLEWYNIYNDRIEVRCIFGRKNVVYYDKVLFVEEVEIDITKGVYKKFYIFNDGRKNSISLDYISCFNRKKFNLRIYKTDKLENFVRNTLNLTVKTK